MTTTWVDVADHAVGVLVMVVIFGFMWAMSRK